MFKINGKIYSTLNHIPCKCGRASNYQIFSSQSEDKKTIALYCDACGNREQLATLEKYIPNPNAPWRTMEAK